MKDKQDLLSKNRIESLCDGVFAIAMTLIILDLKTPENIPLSIAKDELPRILRELLPEAETYAISFIILGVFWLRHVIQMKYIKAVDRKMIAFNLIFLLMIGFVPFSVGVVMRYPDFTLAYVLYDLNLLIISILLSLHWNYASSDKIIISDEITEKVRKRFFILSTSPVFIFLASLIVSFFSVRVAFFILYLDPLFYLVYRKWIRSSNFREAVDEKNE